jgi:hypothetical protein
MVSLIANVSESLRKPADDDDDDDDNEHWMTVIKFESILKATVVASLKTLHC